uniref:Uncharacterized protein n=1 Tax=Rhodosorus marinus TaxID=101924 RepID=A0A6T6KQ80_9RHOD|mmetsp:Transcript_14449/g.21077  ORF Transcript_14449/g.21077 Transcript_14449/m.21077 type:complete len:442 (+) Transcript_14449:466-1791(+)
MAGKWFSVFAFVLLASYVAAQGEDNNEGPVEDPDCVQNGTCPIYAGYQTTTDVRERGEIDLDVNDMSAFADSFDFGQAKAIFQQGKNSRSSTGLRTLEGFSVQAEEKMSDWESYKLFKAYYNDNPAYARDYVLDALDASGEFGGAPDWTRAEASVKGAQYMCLAMYVIHEMEDAVADCNAGDILDNDGGAKAWDETAAFYVGSIVANEADDGVLQYGLAQNRRLQFTGSMDVNDAVMDLLNEGKQIVDAEARNCGRLESIKDEIIDLVKIPLLQGLIRYAFLADENSSGTSSNLPKARGEGNAFARSILPWIAGTDADVGTKIDENFPPVGQAVKDGYVSVVESLDSLYGRGFFSSISADDVGTLTAAEGEESPEDSGLSGGAIAGIVIGVLAGVAILIVAALWFMKRRKSKSSYAKDANAAGDAAYTGSKGEGYVPPEMA